MVPPGGHPWLGLAAFGHECAGTDLFTLALRRARAEAAAPGIPAGSLAGLAAADMRRATYWARTRDQLTGLAVQTGLVGVRWLRPEESGFFQPLLVARPSDGRRRAGTPAGGDPGGR